MTVSAEKKLPDWCTALQDNLTAMAAALPARFDFTPDRRCLFTPEMFGFVPGQAATRAIQQALDAAEKAGGGVVRLAKGEYVSGTLCLKSHVHLEICAGAVLKAATSL